MEVDLYRFSDVKGWMEAPLVADFWRQTLERDK